VFAFPVESVYNRNSISVTGGIKMSEEKKNSYSIHEELNMGEVQIADEVVAIIAGLAATEVEGVASMAGNITNELVGKLGMKNLSRGVKVAVQENEVTVELSLNMSYGYSIPKTSAKVQEKVKSAIESMTGLSVVEVNIHIAGVDMK
jgi:hypothetical protein